MPSTSAGTATFAASPSHSLVEFQLREHRFGVPVSVVREMVRAVAIDRLPRAPAIIEGVINYRGTIVPVLDIRQRFGLPADALHPDQHFILALAGSRLVALRVDRVLGLLDVAEGDIARAAVPGAEHLIGIARLPDGLVVIHDLQQFLSFDESDALDSAMGHG